MSGRRIAAATVALAISVAAGCSTDGSPVPDQALPPTTTTFVPTTAVAPTTAAPTTTVDPTPIDGALSPDGRRYPGTPIRAVAAALRLAEVENQLRVLDPSGTDPEFAELAHEQQMLYRTIGRNPDWFEQVRSTVPESVRPFVELQLAGRRSIAAIPSGDPPTNVPAWEIIEPLGAEELLGLYRTAADDTGIDWPYLAAINLLETGFGRIDGVSTAGAQGPMQFLATTWEEVSNGDINDPHDAIPAAAAYLVRRGGPDNMEKALWGYNNSDAYVASVTAYADLFRSDITSFYAAHAWEIHYSSAVGDLWFPVGYLEQEARPAVQYLLDSPWSAPPPTDNQ